MIYRLSGVLIIILCLFALPLQASSQGAASATLTPPNIEGFPQIEVFLDVQDSSGSFIHGLESKDIRLLEDDNPVRIENVFENRSGAQVVFAISPGATFTVRNSQGVSRYNLVVEALSTWAQNRQGSTIDDMSLITNDGSQIIHVADSLKWQQTLQNIDTESEASETTPGIEVLSQAIDLAADPLPRPGMGRSVIFITPPLGEQASVALQNLSARATQQGVHISIWMVAPPAAPVTPAINRMMELVETTGGRFATLTGEDNLPDPELSLEPLRSVYHLIYVSSIKESGTHQLVAEIQTGDQPITSAPQEFELSVEPPNPAFISPQLEITRSLPEDIQRETDVEDIPTEEYLPRTQDIQILVDFPDGRIRSLTRTTLYVDGEPVDENRRPPFDRFTWDLSVYGESGSHLLQVEAEDALGLTGKSIETLVQINLEKPTSNVWLALSHHTPTVAALVVVLAGAVLLLVLILGGRLNPQNFSLPRRLRRNIDPVTQPIPAERKRSSRRLKKWVNRLSWPQRRIEPNALAFLTSLNEVNGKPNPQPIAITSQTVTLGTDPDRATIVLDDPSVDDVHARLTLDEQGNFQLSDLGSIAGTWINYTPVSAEGASLEHGDLIHIGRVGFRFSLQKSGRNRKTVIVKKISSQESHRDGA
ncbi:MAG: FHA domain-containing protein [Anaerolineales bacterium]